ncbi:MAG: LPS export ABC transporter periplasmic protein LptC [Saprospiraceae bacterium]
MKILLPVLLLFVLSNCTNDYNEVQAITQNNNLNIEEAEDVIILYSDSAALQVRITAKTMIRHNNKSDPYDEFPNGIFVEFLGDNGSVYSWLEADRAIRKEKKSEVITKGNVKFYNKKKETLTSTELIWNENTKKLSTNKFVRIIQPMKGDTSLGFGFETNEEFSQFEIKHKTSSRFNIDNLVAKTGK